MDFNAYLEQDNNVLLGRNAPQHHQPIPKLLVQTEKIARLAHHSQRNVALAFIPSRQVALMFVQMLSLDLLRLETDQLLNARLDFIARLDQPQHIKYAQMEKQQLLEGVYHQTALIVHLVNTALID